MASIAEPVPVRWTLGLALFEIRDLTVAATACRTSGPALIPPRRVRG